MEIKCEQKQHFGDPNIAGHTPGGGVRYYHDEKNI